MEPGVTRLLGNGMVGSRARPLAEWIGRLLLLATVVFWWGAILLPELISMMFPEILRGSALSSQLNPDHEGSLANAVSAAAFPVVALLALGNTVRRLRTQVARNWIAIGGWMALAVAAAYLTVDEIVDPRTKPAFEDLGRTLFGEAYKNDLWPIIFSPLIVAFLVAMGIFILREPLSRAVRVVLIFGFTTWLLAILHDVSHEPLFEDLVSKRIGRLLEETLEFSGTLLIGLGAAISLWGPEPASGMFERRGRFASAVWRFDKLVIGASAIVACIVAVGVLVPHLRRAPLADARADTNIGAFHLILHDKHSLIQELGVLPAPPARIDLRVANHDTQGRSATLIWRVMEAGEGGSDRVLHEGRMEVAAGEQLKRERIDFPPLVETEGRPLALQLVADVEPGAHLRIGATKTNRYDDGRLWVNGAPAWPDQNIEFVAYSAPELTRSKLWEMWRAFTSDWRWPALTADLAVVMVLFIIVPALLITAAVPRRAVR